MAAGVGVPAPSATPCGHFILKTYRFRIYPNRAQRILFEKHFGSCRFVYNHFLDVRRKALEKGAPITLYETHHMVTEMKKLNGYEWLAEVSSASLQASLRNLESAFARHAKEKGNGPPRFHSRAGRKSVTFPSGVRVVDGALKLPKFKTAIKMKMSRPLGGTIRRATITRSSTGKYYAAILCRESRVDLPPSGKSVGIDFGIKDLAVCSDGEMLENPAFLEKCEKRIKFLQRQMDRKQKGSKRRRRAALKLARLHEMLVSRRRDFIHRFTHHVVDENHLICVENLNVKGLMANHRMAKHVASASFREMARQLEYKSKWAGRDFVKVGRFFASSQICSACGYKNPAVKNLKVREWICPKCGTRHDRDVNAARNILNEGKRILSGGEAPSDVKQKSGEAVAQATSKNRRSPRKTRGSLHSVARR